MPFSADLPKHVKHIKSLNLFLSSEAILRAFFYDPRKKKTTFFFYLVIYLVYYNIFTFNIFVSMKPILHVISHPFISVLSFLLPFLYLVYDVSKYY